MFDYSRIDRIDPDFLEQFLVQGEKRDAAFRCPQKLSRKIILDGAEYGVSVEYEREHTLAILWNEYAYDLTAKWGDVKRNYRAKLTQPSTGGRNRVLSEFVPGINDGGTKPAPCPEGLRILREETRCYSVHELMAKGGEKDGEAAVQAGVSELTHEQVRRRVLCFVAMMGPRGRGGRAGGDRQEHRDPARGQPGKNLENRASGFMELRRLFGQPVHTDLCD